MCSTRQTIRNPNFGQYLYHKQCVYQNGWLTTEGSIWLVQFYCLVLYDYVGNYYLETMGTKGKDRPKCNS